MKNQRIEYIDIAKAVGMFIIVYCHMLRRGTAISVLSVAVIPLFFCLSGITFRIKENESFVSFLQKKLCTLIIPYLFAGIVSIVIYSLLGNFAADKLGVDARSTDILPNLLNLFYANAKNDTMKWNNSLWFLPCLFCITVIVWIFEKNISGNKLLVKRIAFMAITFILGQYLSQRLKLVLPLHLETSLSIIYCFEGGIILKPFLSKINAMVHDELTLTKFQYLIISALCIAFGLSLSLLCSNKTISVRTDEYGSSLFLFIISSVLLVMGLLLLCIFFSRHKLLMINSVGQNSLCILLWNKFPVLIVQTLLPGASILSDIDSIGALLFAIIPSIICIAICMYIGFVQRRLLPLTLGENPFHGKA